MKEARRDRSHTVWFRLYEIPWISKLEHISGYHGLVDGRTGSDCLMETGFCRVIERMVREGFLKSKHQSWDPQAEKEPVRPTVKGQALWPEVNWGDSVVFSWPVALSRRSQDGLTHWAPREGQQQEGLAQHLHVASPGWRSQGFQNVPRKELEKSSLLKAWTQTQAHPFYCIPLVKIVTVPT